MIEVEKSPDFFGFEKGLPVACLVSGGIDSMVLLELLARKQKEVAKDAVPFFPLTVIHFNHHLRGAESDRDEQFVQAEAAKRGLPVIVRHLPVKKGSGIQNRAREMRLKAVKSISAETATRCFFLAHQADDQAETVVMRYLRGAGLRGLKGMERESRIEGGILLVRPLLFTPRKAIEAFARREGVSFVTDSSNKKNRYWRNRIRHQLIPELKKGYPELLETVSDNCQRSQEQFRLAASEAEAFLKTYIAPALSVAPALPGRGGLPRGGLPVGRYLNLSPEARFLVLEKKLREAGFGKEVQKHHIEEIEALLMKGKGLKREYGPALFCVDEGLFEFRSSIYLDQ